jgi:hypothetical protein
VQLERQERLRRQVQLERQEQRQQRVLERQLVLERQVQRLLLFYRKRPKQQQRSRRPKRKTCSW